MLWLASVRISPFEIVCTTPSTIAQDDRPEVDLLDGAADAVDLGGIADADLVLGDQEQARDDVFHERLRAEADGQADDARARSAMA